MSQAHAGELDGLRAVVQLAPEAGRRAVSESKVCSFLCLALQTPKYALTGAGAE